MAWPTIERTVTFNRRGLAAYLMLLMVISVSAQAAAQEGTVRLPLQQYHQLVPLAPGAEGDRQPPHAATVSRVLNGHFQHGLLSGELEITIVCSGEGSIDVPIVDAQVALGEVTLNGEAAILQRRDRFYVITLPAGRQHSVRVQFYWGKQQDSATSRVRMRLPPGGGTSLSWRIDEPDIQVTLKRGVVTRSVGHNTHTLVQGLLASSGIVDVSWQRRREATLSDGQWSAKQYVLYELNQTSMTGIAAVEASASHGSFSSIRFSTPNDLEMTGVDGKDVLQWHHDVAHGQLLVRFRHHIEHHTDVTLHFRRALDGDGRPVLQMPWPEVGAHGALGVRAPPGLSLQVVAAKNAEPLLPEKLPFALTELASKPVLLGFGYHQAPEITIAVQQQEQVELTTTLIDELQASTMVLESGREISKVSLRIRNNARQYLKMALPAGAILRHCLIDGRPLRPASLDDALLFPLHQSERIDGKDKTIHKVRPGETLSDIANLYYSDPFKYQRILAANHLDVTSREIEVAQRLIIPAASTSLQERSFVIEVAYERQTDGLGLFGERTLALPTFDVDTVKVLWHVYLPRSHEPLRFDGDLTQLSSIRYDPIRRFQMFIEQALSVSTAHAGGGKYKSVLTTRRSIYRDEVQKQRETQALLSSFPLIGKQYRFRRILPGRHTASLTLSYASQTLLLLSRWASLLACFAAFCFALLSSRRWTSRLVLLLVLGGCFWWGHHVRHIHQSMVFAGNAALLVAILWVSRHVAMKFIRTLWRQPWRLLERLRLKHLGYALLGWLTLETMLMYAPLISLLSLALLALSWWRINKLSAASRGLVAENV